MRFLVDNNLSPALVALMDGAGHDAIHVRTYGLGAASDDVVLQRARDEQRTIISADTDFGALLVQQRSDRPSLLLLRRSTPRRAFEQVRLILANLPAVEDDLRDGAVVVISDERVRVRRLPLIPP